MFAFCYELITVNVSSFDTSKVTEMKGMFCICRNLKYLDLSSFNTSSVEDMRDFFNGINSLVYLNLNSFTIRERTNTSNMFLSLASYLKICINDGEFNNRFIDLSIKISCNNNCFNDNIKINLQTNSCIDNCNESGNKYELNNLCYEICPNTSYLSSYNEYLCLDKSSEDNYYFDNDKNLYKKCYNTCKRCNEGGNETNHNCVECKSGFTFLDETGRDGNCYNNCLNYYYFNESNTYSCTEEKKCPRNFKKLVKEKNKCIDKCENDDKYQYEFNKICYAQCPIRTNQSAIRSTIIQPLNKKFGVQ